MLVKLWKRTVAPPGIPVELQKPKVGAIDPLVRLMLDALIIWQVPQSKAPYLPAVIPHPFAPHFEDDRLALLWMRGLPAAGAVTSVTPLVTCWVEPPPTKPSASMNETLT